MKPYNNDGETKSEEIRTMFNTIAPAYDRLNHILSLQIDKIWRRRVVKLAQQRIKERKEALQPSLLDVATGTGDLAILLSKSLPKACVLGVDPSEGMLAVAQEKILREGLSQRVSIKVQAAESMTLIDNQYDVVTAAFGVRNFSDLRRGLSEMVRVTRNGGSVIVLEFSTPPNPLFRWIYNIYSRHILPRIGALISKDRKAYEYLPASVEEFASPAEFLALMQSVGLSACESRSQCFGIAQIYVGTKN